MYTPQVLEKIKQWHGATAPVTIADEGYAIETVFKPADDCPVTWNIATSNGNYSVIIGTTRNPQIEAFEFADPRDAHTATLLLSFFSSCDDFIEPELKDNLVILEVTGENETAKKAFVFSSQVAAVQAECLLGQYCDIYCDLYF